MYNAHMARRPLAVHVDRIRATKNGRHYESVLLRHSYREGGEVRNLKIANLSDLDPDLVTVIELATKGRTLVCVEDAFKILRSLPHGHVAAVLGTIRKTGLDRRISSRSRPERELVLAMVAERIISAKSKLATSRALAMGTASTALAECLGVQDASEDDLYGAMDWLLTQQEKIEKALAKKHLEDGALVLYDLTSTYFEGRSCPLAKHGYSRDGKPGKLQIEFGLLCNREGCPVAVEVFEGNTADSMTVRTQVQKLMQRFGLRRVVLVGDRGMLTSARLREDVRPEDGVDFVTSLRAPAIRSLVEQGSIQLSLFDERDLVEIESGHYPGERLVVCRNPYLAQERRRRREDLLGATEAELEKILQATVRERNPLKGPANIALRIGKVIDKRKMGKHFIFTGLDDGDEGFSYRRNEASIAEEAALDGLYVIRTSVPAEELSAEEVVGAYKGLSHVERAFRCMKTVDLKVRPIHHHLEGRVRAHVFLCALAYYVEWHIRRDLAPLLFDDEEPWAGAARRSSVVAPARRSESAEAKADTRLTRDGLPVHSFRTLLEDLGTLTRNTCVVAGNRAQHPVIMLSEPTAVQRRAFDLLGFAPRL